MHQVLAFSLWKYRKVLSRRLKTIGFAGDEW